MCRETLGKYLILQIIILALGNVQEYLPINQATTLKIFFSNINLGWKTLAEFVILQKIKLRLGDILEIPSNKTGVDTHITFFLKFKCG